MSARILVPPWESLLEMQMIETEEPAVPKIEITREWLDAASDNQGLTRGQQKLLDIWCDGAPYVGKTIPSQVAVFVEGCRGYRGMPAELKDMLERT